MLAARGFTGAFGGALIRRLPQTRAVSFLLPTIPLLEELRVSKKGYNGLLSNKTADEVWFKHGQQLVDKLNALLAEQKVENTPGSLSELITLSYPNPHLNDVYTYASMLYNLQFAFESLRPIHEDNGTVEPKKAPSSAILQTPTIATEFENEPTDQALREWIIDDFGSIAEFRTLLLNSAKSIKGNGITWLFAQASHAELVMHSGTAGAVPTFDKLGVMNTYNGGIIDDALRSGQLTRLRQDRMAKEEISKKREQERKKINGEDAEVSAAVEATPEETSAPKIPVNILGTLEEAEEAFLYSDRKMIPLLAIDGSMKWYLPDYGVFGKLDYVDNVWRCIDWNVVANRAPPRHKQPVVFQR